MRNRFWGDSAIISCSERMMFATLRAQNCAAPPYRWRIIRCPTPSPATICGCISRRPAAARRSSSCMSSRPITPTGSRRCATSRAGIAASPTPRAAMRHRTCRPRPRSIPSGISTADALAVLDHLNVAQSAFRRPVDGLLLVAAGRAQRARTHDVDDAGRGRLRLEPGPSGGISRTMPGHRRAI